MDRVLELADDPRDAPLADLVKGNALLAAARAGLRPSPDPDLLKRLAQAATELPGPWILLQRLRREMRSEAFHPADHAVLMQALNEIE